MTDELVKRLREPWFTNGCEHYQLEAADRIEALTADKRFIIEERDRTFALMLTRAETAEADNARLRHAIMFWLEAEEPDVDAAINMMRAALKGETP